jgi:hypothetical protein
MYGNLLNGNTKHAISNSEDNVNFVEIMNFIERCLRFEEMRCRNFNDDIGINRCIGRQQGILALIMELDAKRAEKLSAKELKNT